MKLSNALLGSAIAVLSMTSCLGSDTAEQKMSYNYNNSINYVQDLSDNTYTMLDGAAYDIEFDLTAGTATIEISKLMVSPSVSPMTLKLEKVPYTLSKEGSMVISLPSYISSYGDQHTLTGFRMTQLNRIIPQANVSSTVYTVEFTVDNRYRVRAYQKSTILLGVTDVFDDSDGKTQSYDGSTAPYYFYELKFNEKQANVTIFNLKYNGIQQSQIVLEKIPFRIDPDGVKIETSSPIIPKDATEQDNKTVTNFNAVLTSAPAMTIGFTIADMYKVSARLTALGTQSGSSGNQQ